MFSDITRVIRAIWATILYLIAHLKDTRTRSSQGSSELPLSTPLANVVDPFPGTFFPLPVARGYKQGRAIEAEVDKCTGGPFTMYQIAAVLASSAPEVTKDDAAIKAQESIAPREDDNGLLTEFEAIKDTIFDTPRKQKDKWGKLLDKCVAHFSSSHGDDDFLDITAAALAKKDRVVGPVPRHCLLTPASSPSLSSCSEGSCSSGDSTPFPSTPSGDLLRFKTFIFPFALQASVEQRTSSSDEDQADVFGAPSRKPPTASLPEKPASSPVPEERSFPTADCLFEGLESSISFASLLASPLDTSSPDILPEDVSLPPAESPERRSSSASPASPEMWTLPSRPPIQSPVVWSPPQRPSAKLTSPTRLDWFAPPCNSTPPRTSSSSSAPLQKKLISPTRLDWLAQPCTITIPPPPRTSAKKFTSPTRLDWAPSKKKLASPTRLDWFNPLCNASPTKARTSSICDMV